MQPGIGEAPDGKGAALIVEETRELADAFRSLVESVDRLTVGARVTNRHEAISWCTANNAAMAVIGSVSGSCVPPPVTQSPGDTDTKRSCRKAVPHDEIGRIELPRANRATVPSVACLELIGEMRRRFPEIPVICFPPAECMAAAVIGRMIDAGVKGCVDRNCEDGEMRAAIRTVAGGGMYMCPSATALVEHYRSDTRAEAGRPAGVLSFRELDVALLLASGATMAQAAETLGVSVYTVASH